jgi:GTP-binding protein EngB required for normal cell division
LYRSKIFFYQEFTDEPNRILEYIFPILLRFCSIHNELGDRFIIGEGEKAKSYDLIQNYFPFNINIACIGRFRQGKSTGVNAILKEYKAKESARGNSQTKNLTFYHVNGKAIKVLDIPGFEDNKTVQNAVKLFQECGKEINHIRDNLHIILYFLNFTNDGQFMEMESPMIEEISKHQNSKLIYVMTHSPSNYNIKKNSKIKQIKQGIQKLVENKAEDLKKLAQPGGMLYPDENNVVFVHFYDDILSNNKAFGKKKLFLKIYDSFIQTEEYKEFYRKKEINEVKNKAEELKIRARRDLFKYKFYGSCIGLVPFVDLLVQKYVIKKKIITKLANMFGFQPTFFDEKSEEKPDTPIYITKSIEKDKLPTNLDKEQIEELQNKENKTSIGIKEGAGATTYALSTTGFGASSFTVTASTIGTTTLKVAGAGFLVVGMAIGTIAGGVLTHNYINDLIEVFSDLYIKNYDKISDCYQNAANHFLI